MTRSVLVTDSGLGGLSVAAALADRFRRAGAGLELTYFNAWPEADRGYNRMPSRTEQVRVLDAALLAMARLDPELILIACNTLSVLYPWTGFSRAPAVPVIDIVTLGLELIHERMRAQPGSQVILFGTLTTIASDAHRAGLVARGIEPGRIVTQVCDRLAAEIEQGPASATVREMVGRFAGQAASRLADPRAPVLAALCCTHYNYSAELFRAALAPAPVTIVNPNEAMAACLRPAPDGGAVRARVLSRIVLDDPKVAAIARQVRPVSPQVADALIHYRHDPELFSY